LSTKTTFVLMLNTGCRRRDRCIRADSQVWVNWMRIMKATEFGRTVLIAVKLLREAIGPDWLRARFMSEECQSTQNGAEAINRTKSQNSCRSEQHVFGNWIMQMGSENWVRSVASYAWIWWDWRINVQLNSLHIFLQTKAVGWVKLWEPSLSQPAWMNCSIEVQRKMCL